MWVYWIENEYSPSWLVGSVEHDGDSKPIDQWIFDAHGYHPTITGVTIYDPDLSGPPIT